MITTETFRKLALSLPGTEEMPHFDKTSFRVKKKIFATLSVTNLVACIKLSPVDQSVFCAFDKEIIYPVNNKWGLQGWTNIDLSKIPKPMLEDALTVAYNEVLASKLKRL